MNKFVLAMAVIAAGPLPFSSFSNDETDKIWIRISSEDASFLEEKSLQLPFTFLKRESDTLLLEGKIDDLSKMGEMGHALKKCGGFYTYFSKAEALADEVAAEARTAGSFSQYFNPELYNIDQHREVLRLINEVKPEKILATISELSQFHNRYYTSDTGVAAVKSLAQKWQAMGDFRKDFSVTLVNHERFAQPSIIARLEGRELPDEIIVIGGHVDSINGSKYGKAPGADDNASGIAAMTEAMRIILASGLRPKRSIHFMAYAAEEVGLIGSRLIASEYRSKSKNVVGAFQLDMTGYRGSDFDIVMMTDFTDAEQNKFLGSLIDTYVKVPWGHSRCGYACSDHASWNRNGYPVSFPFESTMEDSNQAIHSTRDTLQTLGDSAHHAAGFSRLAISYLVEMSL